MIMNAGCAAAFAITWLILGVVSWLGWQLLRQNGRILLRLDELEQRVNELEFAEADDQDDSHTAPKASNGEDERTARFSNHSLTRSRIKRDGLKAGTPAPDFHLPCLDGRELSLQDFRGSHLLLIFSDPHCGPCQALAPHLERFHRENTGLLSLPSPRAESIRKDPFSSAVQVLMISRGEPGENRAKVKEHGLTFPVLLQQRWEISRLYAMFATPIGYLVNDQGIIAQNVAVGVEAIQKVLADATAVNHQQLPGQPTGNVLT
jgi:peroxiredoxin